MIAELINFCGWETSRFLIISANVFDDLIYYSHLLPAVVAFIVGIFVLTADPRSLANRIFSGIMFVFCFWVSSDLVLWASEKPDYIMFFWSMTILFEPIIYGGCVYFLDVLINKQDISNNKRLAIFLLLAPTIILTPTYLAISAFDITNCEREVIQGPLVTYSLLSQIVFVIWIILFSVKSYFTNTDKYYRKQVLIISSGIIMFLTLFSLGNIVGTFTDNWQIGQYGILGMPILIAFFAYSVAKFKTLNVKIISTQILVLALIILIGSLLFVVKSPTSRVISTVTFVISVIFGNLLINSVKKEIETKEYAQGLAEALAKSNDDLFSVNQKLKDLDRQKTEFVSMASHQLRTPLTAIKGYSSMLLEGSFGKLDTKTQDAVDVIYQSSQRLVSVIEDFLNVTRIELGRMKYDMTMFDIRDLVKKISDELIPFAKRKKIKFTVTLGEGAYQIHADYGKISQVVSNVIDNAIKYTPEGSVSVDVTRPTTDPDHIHIIVKDTGVGIASESIPKLFQKFIRADEVGKTHISGTGLGLYVVKQIIDAHKGSVSVESPGVGKGSTFTIILKAYTEGK